MPVILEQKDWPLWLGEAEGDVSSLLRPADDGVLRLWPISTAVNAVRNNGPDLLTPMSDPDVLVGSDAPPGPNSA
jgi:putative SOS response-associated peptidase YedK